MNKLIIDKKILCCNSTEGNEQLLTKAASKASPAKKLSLDQGKKLAYKLIDKWAKEK